jgi:hypothetical protein
MMKYIAFSLSIFLMFSPTLRAQIENPVVFDLEDTDSLLYAEFYFSPLPEYNKECNLTFRLVSKDEEVNVHAFKSPNIKRDDLRFIRPDILIEGKELDFKLTIGPDRYVSLADTILSWVPPIEVEDSFKATVPFIITGVGQYTMQLLEMDNTQDMIRMMVSIVIDEEGKLVYLGKFPPPHSYPLGAHHYIFGDEIKTHIVGKSSESSLHKKSWPEPYDIEMTFSPVPEIGMRTNVDIKIEPKIPQVTDLQYEIIGATNLFMDSLSPSPGRVASGSKRSAISFQMVPQKPGRSYISFEIFGYRPGAERTQMPFSRIDYHMVFGSDSSLLYMGEIDPFAVGYQAGIPAYGAIDEISEFSGTGYGEKVYRSEPDYEQDRIREQFVRDSIKASQAIDTMETEDQQ